MYDSNQDIPSPAQIFNRINDEKAKELWFNKITKGVIDAMGDLLNIREWLLKIRTTCLDESEILKDLESTLDNCDGKTHDVYELINLRSIKECNKLISVITYKTDLSFSVVQALKIHNDVSKRLDNVYWIRDLRDDEIIQEIINQYT